MALNPDSKITIGLSIILITAAIYVSSIGVKSEALAERLGRVEDAQRILAERITRQNEIIIDRLGRIEERLRIIKKNQEE